VVEVIGEIRRQEQDRDRERCDLAGTMRHYIPRADKRVTGEQQDCACAIKTSIKVWQIRNVLGNQAYDSFAATFPFSVSE
jgi:hypothetical protein